MRIYNYTQRLCIFIKINSDIIAHYGVYNIVFKEMDKDPSRRRVRTSKKKSADANSGVIFTRIFLASVLAAELNVICPGPKRTRSRKKKKGESPRSS